MYSSFIVGYMIKVFFGSKKQIKNSIKVLEDLVFAFFVPIYFSLVGVQLNVVHDFSWLRFMIFFIIAFGLEFFGTYIMLLFSNLSNDMKMNFAITMNARGGPGIVLATVSYSAGIINLEFFTVLILTTMISSLIVGYYLRYQQKKDKNIFNSL